MIPWKTLPGIKFKKARKRSSHEEFHLQCQLVQWFRTNPATKDFIICSIPNGGSRNLIEAKNLKRSGCLAGMPDLFIPYFKVQLRHEGIFDLDNDEVYAGLFLELKSKGGKLSESQEYVIDKLRNFGYKCIVVSDFEVAQKEIKTYLGIGRGR